MKNSNQLSKGPLHVPEFCPNCNKKYSKAKVNVLNNQEGNIIVHITCPNCLSSVISSISLAGPKITALGMLTDVDKNDLNLFYKKEMVTYDDVIDMHETLEKEGRINFNQNL
ncbi:MAG: hypothetical protein GF335_00340 [Candidatus Moranbacteria bacterium]|nr:hypothetical protein [Candidatus Moranbacteria bacterium]